MQAGKIRNERKKKLEEDDRVDEGIRETFPASDATATGKPTSTEPAGRPTDREAPTISREEIEDARKGKGHAQNDSIKRPR